MTTASSFEVEETVPWRKWSWNLTGILLMYCIISCWIFFINWQI